MPRPLLQRVRYVFLCKRKNFYHHQNKHISLSQNLTHFPYIQTGFPFSFICQKRRIKQKLFLLSFTFTWQPLNCKNRKHFHKTHKKYQNTPKIDKKVLKVFTTWDFNIVPHQKLYKQLSEDAHRTFQWTERYTKNFWDLEIELFNQHKVTQKVFRTSWFYVLWNKIKQIKEKVSYNLDLKKLGHKKLLRKSQRLVIEQ